MADIFVGSVSIGVTPDARGIDDELRRQLIPPSNTVGGEMGKEMTKAIISNLDIGRAFTDSVRANLAQIARAGDDAGKVFADASKAKIKEEFARETIDAKLHLDTLSAKAEWEKFKTETEKGKGIVAKIATDTTSLTKNITSGITAGVTRARGPISSFFGRLFGGGSGGGGAAGNIAGGIAGAATAAAGGAGGAAAAGTTAAAAGDSGGIISSITGWVKGLPWGLIAFFTALSPWIAQAIGGALISFLGGGIAAMAGYGAFQDQRVAGQGFRQGPRGTFNVQQPYTPDLASEFTSVFSQAKGVLVQMGASFIPVLQSVAKAISGTITALQPVFGAASAIIAPSVQNFLTTLVTAFSSPAVQKSIISVANAFASILTAITPDVTGGVASIAESISRIATSVSNNPKAFADFVNFLFQVGIFGLDAIWVLTSIANYIEQHFLPAVKSVNKFFSDLFSWTSIAAPGQPPTKLTKWWDNTVIPWAKKAGADLVNGIWHGIDSVISAGGKWIHDHFVQPFINFFTSMQFGFGTGSPSKKMEPIGVDIVNGIWQGILSVMKGAGAWVYNNIYQPFVKAISSAFGMAGGEAKNMITFGIDIVYGFLDGILQAMKDIGSWIDANVYQPIKKAIIDNFKITSPAKTMIPIGKQVIQGIIHGMISEGKHFDTFVADVFGSWPKAIIAVLSKGNFNLASLPKTVFNFINSLTGLGASTAKAAWNWLTGGGGAAGGVARWASTVSKALTMLHLPQSLSGQVLYQMQTESGGNQNAINLTDINAKRGDPSRGLMQVIGSTFQQYHVPGTSWNIYDPLANVAAAINYAEHRYGKSLMSGSSGLGSGHGYDAGGWLPPGVTMAVNNTGSNELVLSPAQQAELLGSGRVDTAIANGPTYNAHFDGLTTQAIQAEVRTAFQMMSLTQGHIARPGRRT